MNRLPGNAAALEAYAGATVDVLLIEDDRVDEMALMREVASEGIPYRMQVARSLAQARALLATQAFDVILADYRLADGTSFELMREFADTLVIFVTGAWDDAAAASALRLGVHDYLIKDADRKYLKLLHYRVQTALRQRRTERRLRDSEARLQAILDHAPASISARDPQGRLILSNRHHDAITSDATLAARALQPCLPGADVLQQEETLNDRDGSQRTYLTVRFPIPGDAERPLAEGAISVDISSRKLAEKLVHDLAFYDPLTALPNRRMLGDRLQQAFATSARHDAHGAVFFIDLDHFKQLNDSLGHDHGDLLLQQVATRLLQCVRGEDTVARIGGDEFVVMTVSLHESARTAARQAATVGQKILQAVSQPFQLGRHVHAVTPSIGVTLFKGREASAEELIKRADVAMYQAKAAGRGTVRFFDPVMQAALDTRLALETDLALAEQAGQLRLHYQGQIETGQGAVGVEALLRWQHPQLGLLLPEQFLPLAEQSGMIVSIGQWVLDSACAQLVRWADHPRWGRLSLAVNVSARQFRQQGFADRVAQTLQAHGANPARLRLELREALLQDDPAQTLTHMKELKGLGVGFVMEDFGISYSSLASLRRLPMDQIKISQALVARLMSDPHDAAIVGTIVGIARSLGLGAVAAGVETAQQRDALQALGCSVVQGYYYGRPAPLAQFETLLDSDAYLATPAQ